MLCRGSGRRRMPRSMRPNKEHEPRWQTVWLHHSEQRVLGKLPFDGTAQQSRLSHQFHRRGAGDA